MNRICSLQDLSKADQALVLAARDASARAYAPYSGFAVGTAVRTQSGHVYTGANLENASYGLGICAEVSVMAAANAASDDGVETIAVVGHKFTEPQDSSQIVTPCGRCRQVISEAAQVAKNDIRVLSCNGSLTEIEASTISELLPRAFGPANLGLDKAWPSLRAKLATATRALGQPADADGRAVARPKQAKA